MEGIEKLIYLEGIEKLVNLEGIYYLLYYLLNLIFHVLKSEGNRRYQENCKNYILPNILYDLTYYVLFVHIRTL